MKCVASFTGRLHSGSAHSCECVAMGSTMPAALVMAALFAPPFFMAVRAKSSCCVHEPAVDLPPPSLKMLASEEDDLPPPTSGAPALTASIAALCRDFLPPCLRSSSAACWYACHPVVPALATALRPSLKMRASEGDDLPPPTSGAPALMTCSADNEQRGWNSTLYTGCMSRCASNESMALKMMAHPMSTSHYGWYVTVSFGCAVDFTWTICHNEHPMSAWHCNDGSSNESITVWH